MKPAPTETIVSALRVLSVEMHSEDGVANAVVAEAADRLTLMANLVARHIEETKKDTQEMQTACETMNGATETIQRLKDRIKRLEEELIDAKNKHAALVADVALYEDRGERIKRLEDRIRRLEEAGGELICYLSHRIKTDKDDPIWHTASIKWGKVKKEAKP